MNRLLIAIIEVATGANTDMGNRAIQYCSVSKGNSSAPDSIQMIPALSRHEPTENISCAISHKQLAYEKSAVKEWKSL